MDDETTSADQDAWVEIAQAVREQIRRRIPDMGAMKPDEISAFVEAARCAQWFEEACHVFDRELELRRQRVTYYG